MKVLVYFEPSIKYDVFEAARVRKNIKGALEEMNIELSKTLVDNFDIAHFISIKDEKIIDEALELGKKVVISCLSNENDVVGKITHLDEKGTRKLTLRAIKVLNKVHTVIVPSLADKYFLLKEGITSPIEVIEPGVNIKRFQNIPDRELELFYRYFGERKGNKVVVACGNLSKTKEINKFISLAALLPTIKFYYFGVTNSSMLVTSTVNKLNKKATSNLLFSPVVEDDIYRSTMAVADIFVVLNPNSASSVSVEDALAANSQIIAFGPLKEDSLLIDGDSCYVTSSILETSHFIKDYFAGNIPSTTSNGYKIAKKTSLKEMGKKLVKLYEKLLNQKGE